MNYSAHDYISKMAGPLKTDAVLTKTETIIASGYVCGLSGKEIADINSVSYRTVIQHTQNIYQKTGIRRGVHALVAWFLAENLELDLSEFRRRAGAAVCLAVVCIQLVTSDFDRQFMRTRGARQIEARTARARRTRKDETETFTIA